MQRKFRQILNYGLGAIALSLIVVACQKFDEIEVRPVTFQVDANTTSITVTESIDYTDNSVDVASREWTFEGGSIGTSTNMSETVTYPDTGRFATMLTVNFQDGTVDDRLFYVNISPFVEADFAASATTVVFGNDVTFTNLTKHVPLINSRPDTEGFEDEKETWIWEFEGAIPETSKEMSPTVRYPEVGTYKVKLTANRNYPSNSDAEEKLAYINVVDVAVISPETVKTCDFGSTIRLTYPEELAEIPVGGKDAFMVLADGNPAVVTSVESDPNNAMGLIINLENPILDGQTVEINYDPNVALFTAQSGSIFAPLANFLVLNQVKSLFAGNVDFEVGAIGDFPPDWGTWNPTQSINNNEQYAITDEDAVSGSNSAKWTYDGSMDQWILDNKSPSGISVGGTYRVTFWARTSMPGKTLDLRVIESGWATAVDPADFVLNEEWTQYSFDYDAVEAGNNDRKIWMATPASSDVFDIFLDDIRMYFLGCE